AAHVDRATRIRARIRRLRRPHASRNGAIAAGDSRCARRRVRRGPREDGEVRGGVPDGDPGRLITAAVGPLRRRYDAVTMPRRPVQLIFRAMRDSLYFTE